MLYTGMSIENNIKGSDSTALVLASITTLKLAAIGTQVQYESSWRLLSKLTELLYHYCLLVTIWSIISYKGQQMTIHLQNCSFMVQACKSQAPLCCYALTESVCRVVCFLGKCVTSYENQSPILLHTSTERIKKNTVLTHFHGETVYKHASK